MSDAKEKEKRRQAGMKALMEVAEQATENLTRIFVEQFEIRRRGQQQQQIPINNPPPPQLQSPSELDHTCAARVQPPNNTNVLHEDEVLVIQPANNTKTQLNVHQNLTANSNFPMAPNINVPESQTVQQITTTAFSSNQSNLHERRKGERIIFPEVVDKLILEYAKWSMEGNRKHEAFQLLLENIGRVIGHDAKRYYDVVSVRVSTLRKKIRTEQERQFQQQQQIPPRINDLPSTSYSSQSTATSTPASDILAEQEYLLNRAMKLEQHSIETNGLNSQRVMLAGHFDENENPIMNLMERFGEKFDQNAVVRNINTPGNGDQEEVGYEEIDGLAKAERNDTSGGFGHEFGDDPEASSMSSQTDGFLDDRNTTTVQNNNNIVENASTAPPSNLTENIPTSSLAENIPNSNLNKNMEIDESPLQNEPNQILMIKNGQNQNNNVIPLQGEETNPKGKKPNLARRSKPFDKFNTQNQGLVRKFCKVSNQSSEPSKEGIDTTGLIIRKTRLLEIVMTERKMNQAAEVEKKQQCVKPEPRSEFDDVATSSAAGELDGNVETNEKMTETVEQLPPLFRPPPLLKHGRNAIVQVFVEDLGKKMAKKKKTSISSRNLLSVKKRQLHRSPSP